MPGYDWYTDKTIVDAGRWSTEHGTDMRRAEKRYGIDKSVHVFPNFLPDYALQGLGQEGGGEVLDVHKLVVPWWVWALGIPTVAVVGYFIGRASRRG